MSDEPIEPTYTRVSGNCWEWAGGPEWEPADWPCEETLYRRDAAELAAWMQFCLEALGQ
jgi:hypothetical protein